MTGRTRRFAIRAALATVVVVVGVVAVVSLAGGEDSEPSRVPSVESSSQSLEGPHSPAEGSLGGRLLVGRGDDCALHQIDLNRVRIDRAGTPSGCDVWVSPAGDLAVTQSVVAWTEGGSRHSLLAISDEIVAIDDQPILLRNPVRWRGIPAWGPESDTLAICGPEDTTVVVDLESDEKLSLAGCWPTFSASGSVLTLEASTTSILEDGETRLDLDAIRAGLPDGASSSGELLGYEGGHEAQEELAGSPIHSIRFGPDDRELAITARGQVDEIVVIDSRTGGVVLGPSPYASFDWSPDGQWLGIATAEQIEIYGPDRSPTPTFTLPVSASSLAWRASLAPS